jgi:hypothetical protein
MAMVRFTPIDIGLAIRDFVEKQGIFHFNQRGEQTEHTVGVDFVDISDPGNLRVVLSNNQMFNVRITRS